MTRRVIVCGGRDFNALSFVERALDGQHNRSPIGLVIHGAATGADTCAKAWAVSKGIDVEDWPVTKADWARLGKRAGMARNRAMLNRLIELGGGDVIAFPGGNGTRGMCNIARKAGVKVWSMEFQWVVG